MIQFYKYQGTGNDFVMIDNRDGSFDSDNLELISRMCDRRFGIGADGLILLENDSESDFYVNYFNADGSKSFCGNGARCAVRFASDLGLVEGKTSFNAIDGFHDALIYDTTVAIKMGDVSEIDQKEEDIFVLDTGSPHYVSFVNDLDEVDIVKTGKSIRYSNEYKAEGINVNIAEHTNQILTMLTYERGVEDETFSCGTGATAVALAFKKKYDIQDKKIALNVKGGQLEVSSEADQNGFTNIWLEGPAKKVFQGTYE